MTGPQLLERDPRKRLGGRTGFSNIEEIRSHRWFSHLDWEKLETKQLDPPFVPNVSRILLGSRGALLIPNYSKTVVISTFLTSWTSSSWLRNP